VGCVAVADASPELIKSTDLPVVGDRPEPGGAAVEGGRVPHLADPAPARSRQEIDNWANSRPGRQIQQAAARVKAAASGSE
jgi:hypothetical protein